MLAVLEPQSGRFTATPAPSSPENPGETVPSGRDALLGDFTDLREPAVPAFVPVDVDAHMSRG